jgi:hypothetical protein
MQTRVRCSWRIVGKFLGGAHFRRGGCTSLMVAAMFGQAEAVSLLAAAGADVDATARKGATALHYAAGTIQ